jgi:hypothetical protein
MSISSHYSIFNQSTCVASGELSQLAPQVAQLLTLDPHAQLLAFADDTGLQTDFNWAELATNLTVAPKPSPDALAAEIDPVRKVGRPKLGVVAREVTLLPRHWEWLGQQSGGASVALRKLVDAARKAGEGKALQRQAMDRTYRVMTALAGNEVGFEEALRALYAADQTRFVQLSATWPVDIQTYLQRLSANAFAIDDQIG